MRSRASLRRGSSSTQKIGFKHTHNWSETTSNGLFAESRRQAVEEGKMCAWDSQVAVKEKSDTSMMLYPGSVVCVILEDAAADI